MSHIVEDVDIACWGFSAYRVLEDGRVAIVLPQVFNTILTVSSPESWRLGCRDDVFTYMRWQDAVAALEAWDGSGEPEGWVRHQPSNRRRPEGDPAWEYVSE